jgi:CO dehydrogenase maturation factor
MKLAISGKGGVGKTTLSSLLARELKNRGFSVLMVDADPDANLAGAIGMPDPEQIAPITDMKELIADRTGSKPGTLGGFFKLNPTVNDLPAKLAKEHNGIKLMVLGTVKSGQGCICPESALLKALLSHLFINEKDAVVLDMEAGLEHLGRGTALGVDMMIVVVEPGRRSLETAFAIKKLATELGIKKIGVVASKVQSDEELVFLKENVGDMAFLGHMPYSEPIRNADFKGESLFDLSDENVAFIKQIVDELDTRIK